MKVESFQQWTKDFDRIAGIDNTGQEIPIALHAAEEMGEVAQCILKLTEWKKRKDETVEHLQEEICDVIVLMFKLANCYDIDIKEGLEIVKAKLERRWKVSVDKA